MVSLHACGRLSPTLMQHFCLLEEDGVCALICIGCCYHKLATGAGRNVASGRDLAGYFPLSDALGRLLKSTSLGGTEGRLQGLRLACQETRHSWGTRSTEGHLLHLRSTFFRALLQIAREKHGLEWSKCKRRVARQGQFSSFGTYLEHTLGGMTHHSEEERDTWRRTLENLHDRHLELLPALGAHAVRTPLARGFEFQPSGSLPMTPWANSVPKTCSTKNRGCVRLASSGCFLPRCF